MERLDTMGQSLSSEINDLDAYIKKVETHMGEKMNYKDSQKIWQHFQRFAEYSDLKDLYSKTIPELAKFEQKIIDFQTDSDKMHLVISRFDEHLTKKASKD